MNQKVVNKDKKKRNKNSEFRTINVWQSRTPISFQCTNSNPNHVLTSVSFVLFYEDFLNMSIGMLIPSCAFDCLHLIVECRIEKMSSKLLNIYQAISSNWN